MYVVPKGIKTRTHCLQGSHANHNAMEPLYAKGVALAYTYLEGEIT